MRRIGIDARLIKQTGVGTYLQNLLYYLPQYRSSDIDITIFCLPIDKSFVQSFSDVYRVVGINTKWHTFSEQLLFLSTLMKANLHLMHFTYFSYPFLYPRPYITTIHDITPLQYRTGRASTKNKYIYTIKYITLKQLLARQVYQSKAIITPTRTVKDMLLLHYGNKIEKKIYPIYEGVSFSLFQNNNGNLETKHKDYYLYIGNFYPHKNISLLMKIFSEYILDTKLIVAGPKDFFSKQMQDFVKLKKSKNIIFSYPQDISAIQKLYTRARALIHPSFSEGFGLPLIEAAYYRLPIIASDIPVFRELLGENYYAFNPYDSNSLVSAIRKFENDSVKKIADINKEYSFSLMAKKTMELYKMYV